MTEHPEPPRVDGASWPTRRRFARLVASPRVRRLAPARLVLAAAAVSAVFGVASWLLSTSTQQLIAWLHQQPDYQLPFHEIALDPPPPPWYRGGAQAFLDRVREASGRTAETISVLDVPPDQLKRDFGLYCWVDKVLRVERSYPNRIVVRLEYRMPVAAPRSLRRAGFVLDKEGVLLPAKDLEPEALAGLIPIEGEGLREPLEPRAGEVWKVGDGSGGPVEPNGHAIRAAKLAAFLKTAQASAPAGERIPRVASVVVSRRHGLFLMFADKTCVYWKDAPGDEEPGQLSAAAKWRLLRRWFQRPDARAVWPPFYLDFNQRELVERRSEDSPSHDS